MPNSQDSGIKEFDFQMLNISLPETTQSHLVTIFSLALKPPHKEYSIRKIMKLTDKSSGTIMKIKRLIEGSE